MVTNEVDNGPQTTDGDEDLLVRCKALEVGYAGRSILPPITLSIQRGEFWAVIGRNGSGKTTWLRTLLGLQPAVGGSVERISALRLSYLPQRSAIDELYPLLAREVVGMGMLRQWSFFRLPAARQARVREALEEMGVRELQDRPFRQLSEGQKQRILFARLAASGAALAILDEPTSAMDLVAEREAFELIDKARKRHRLAVLVVSHYLGVAKEFADRAILLDRDLPAVVTGTPDEVFEHPAFRRRYGDSVRPPADR
jgi:zinc transport system ATP-binding protein